MSDRTLVVWNPSAGSSGRNARLREELEFQHDVFLHQTHSREDAEQLVRDFVLDGGERVLAAGGDGTVHTAAAALLELEADVALGVLPLGTGNDFCRALGIPLAPYRALEAFRADRRRRIDAVRAGLDEETTWFVNMASGGNSAAHTVDLDDQTKRRWGPLSYLLQAGEILQHLVRYRARLEFDDGTQEELEALNVFVGNGRTAGGGLPVTPQASLEDGLLDVLVVRLVEGFDLTWLAAEYVFTHFLDSEHVLFRRARSVSVESDPPMTFSLDGEHVRGTTRFSVEPNALKVVVGPDYVPAPRVRRVL